MNEPNEPITKTPTLAGAAITNTIALARRHPIATLVAVVLGVYLVLYTFPAFFAALRHGAEDRKVEKLENAADKEKTDAAREKLAAGEIETERKAEDLNRHNNLEPQRDRANVALAEASRRRKEIEDRYAKNRATVKPDLDPDTLRRRNCSELAELYPGERFAGCQ